MNQKNISVPREQESSSIKSVELTKEKIKKVAKKLHQNLKEKVEMNQGISLAVIQEGMASALGFRNWNSLDKVMENQVEKIAPIKNVNETIIKPNFFQNLNAEDLTKLSIIKQDCDNMWSSRAISCALAVFKVVEYLKNKGEIELSTDNLFQFFEMRKIENLLNNSDIPNEVKKDLWQYVVSLPGYKRYAPKQSESVLENHGYITMFLFSSSSLLELIINEDMCIWDEKWLELKKENEIVGLYLEKSIFKESDFNEYKKLLKLNMVSSFGKGKIYASNILEMYLATIGGGEVQYYKKMLENISNSWLRYKSITEALNIHITS